MVKSLKKSSRPCQPRSANRLAVDSPDHPLTFGIYPSIGKTMVPLNQVADLYSTGELNRIMRYNQQRTVTISAKNQMLKASEIFASLKPILAKMEFPKHHYSI